MHRYTTLNVDILESLLLTHVRHLSQLVTDIEVNPRKIAQVEETIAKIKSSIRMNEDFGRLTSIS